MNGIIVIIFIVCIVAALILGFFTGYIVGENTTMRVLDDEAKIDKLIDHHEKERDYFRIIKDRIKGRSGQ